MASNLNTIGIVVAQKEKVISSDYDTINVSFKLLMLRNRIMKVIL